MTAPIERPAAGYWLRSCPGCGQDFTTTDPRKRYCSNACRQRAYRRRHRDQHPTTRFCRMCRQPFTVPPGPGRPPRFCSPTCRKQLWRIFDYGRRPWLYEDNQWWKPRPRLTFGVIEDDW